MPGQNLKFIRSCDGAHQNPLIQTVPFQFLRKGFQFGVRVGVEADVGSKEWTQLSNRNVTELRIRLRNRNLENLLIRRVAGL